MAVIGSDQVTIVDLTDGYSVSMSPESYAFPGTVTTAKAGSVGVLIEAFVGAVVAAASVTIGEIVGLPTGVSVVKDTNPTTPMLTVSVTTAVTAPGIISIPVHVGEVTIVKRFAYSIAFTGSAGGNGSPGVSATNVVVGNEAVVIPCTAAGATSAAGSVTVGFAGYVGAARAAATVTATNLPSGITVGTNTAATTGADGSLVLNIASGSTLGGAASGNITLTFVSNSQTFVRLFTWTKAVAGSNGSNGADAILLAVTSSNGQIFKNTAIATTLLARVFKGGVEQLGAALTALGTIKWYKDGGSTPVGTGASLVLDAGMVTSRAVYEARLEN